MEAATRAVYPHTIRVDARGMVWFTLTGSEQVGRLDPESGEFTILMLPTHKPQGIAGTTQPYGIDVNPVDGSIWYGRLFADKIGRINPDTLDITEYDSPIIMVGGSESYEARCRHCHEVPTADQSQARLP